MGTFDGVAPEGPVAPVASELVAPVFDLEQVMETEEVMAARAEHFRLVAEHTAAVDAANAAAAADAEEAVTEATVEEVAAEEAPIERRKRQVFYTGALPAAIGALPSAIPVVAPQTIVHPEFYSALQAAPVDLTPAEGTVVAPAPLAPVVHDGELLRIENNPGHAVSYRVY